MHGAAPCVSWTTLIELAQERGTELLEPEWLEPKWLRIVYRITV